MTFDFAPNWLDGLTNRTDHAAPRPLTGAAIPSGVLPGVVPPPCPPPHPTLGQMADLVGELFTEGSLSFEQLCSLSNVPELEPLLGDTVAGVAPARRVPTRARR